MDSTIVELIQQVQGKANGISSSNPKNPSLRVSVVDLNEQEKKRPEQAKDLALILPIPVVRHILGDKQLYLYRLLTTEAAGTTTLPNTLKVICTSN